jgi:hypothetical protein
MKSGAASHRQTNEEDNTMFNFSNISQANFGILTGPQTNVALLSQGPALLNVANIHQTNVGFGTASQTNIAVVSQG